MLTYVGVDCHLVLQGCSATRSYHHSLCMTIKKMRNVLAEVLDDNLHLLRNVSRV